MTVLPRLLQGLAAGAAGDMGSHEAVLDPLPDLRHWASGRVIDEVDRSGLRGRGGAAFPVATKMRAVAGRRGPRIVLGNGTEGEPASAKDRLLLTRAPQLVLDGASVASRAVDAGVAVIRLPTAITRSSTRSRQRSTSGGLRAAATTRSSSCTPAMWGSSPVRNLRSSTRCPGAMRSRRSRRARTSRASAGARRWCRTSRRSRIWR
jgi:hypothetical protein